jgi:hypothetical protein
MSGGYIKNAVLRAAYLHGNVAFPFARQRCGPGTSCVDTSPCRIQPSRNSHVFGNQTQSAWYSFGGLNSVITPSRSRQPQKLTALENGSTFHVAGKPSRSWPCFLQLFKTYASA